MRAIPTEQLANTLNHAFKELIRRQQHVIGEFDKLGIEFFKHIEKTADARTYQPILEMFQILNKWMVDRLDQALNFTEQIITQKKSYEMILQQEKNICLEIFKIDVNRLNSIRQAFFQYQQYLKKDWQREIVEYQLLNQICLELQIDYPQLLAAMSKLEDQNSLLLDLFQSHNKERGFVYQFYLKYVKRKVIFYEETRYLCECLKKFLIIIQRNSNGVINMIQNDQSLVNEEFLIELQSIIKFHVEIQTEISEIVTNLIKITESSHEVIKSKYTKYMLIVLEMQQATSQSHFHDCIQIIQLDLMQKLSLTLAGMVQANVVRDLCFNNFIIDLSELIFYQINNLNNKTNQNLKNAVQQFNQSNNQFMLDSQIHNYVRGEESWNDMIKVQKETYEKQIKEYENVLQFRKQSYLKDPSRFCNNPKVNNLSSLDLPLTTKEFFKLFLIGDEHQNFFAQFKTNVMKEIQVKFSQYEPQPPNFFLTEENFDLKQLIDQCYAIKRVITFKTPNKDRIKLFAPEFLNCKCEQFVYFISDKEIMVEQEIFAEGNDYSSMRRYMHIIQQNNNECTLHYGYFKQELKFNFLGVLDIFSINDEKEMYEQQLQPAMIKCVQQYLQNKDQMAEERKKQFILNNNIDYMLNQQSKLTESQFQPNMSFIKQPNVLQSNKWTLANLLSQDALMKMIFFLLILNFFKPTVG